MINRYTVVGQPIAHSLSPVVHQLFGELTQRKIDYTRTESTPQTFAQTILDWQKSGAKGCNVTAPFKEQAFEVCQRIVPNAKRAGSVNTIHMHRDGKLVGYNTDGAGLVADIVINKRRAIESRRVLMLGAGGAARGVVAPLLGAGPKQLHIANRTAAKAIALADMFDDLGAVSGGGYDELASAEPYDIIINATTLSMEGGLPPIPDNLVNGDTFAYDMTYGKDDTPFMTWCQSKGSVSCNGLGMLVEQAAESFFIWEGVRPKTRLVYPRLRELLAK